MLFKILLLITHVAFGISNPLFDDEDKKLDNFGLNKRGYTYVSEYKRLPVYNFGLGKRADSRNLYSFGLGKRDYSEELSTEEMVDAEKRSKDYNFGLGKRLTSGYNFEPSRKPRKNYNFGLGKRLAPSYSFGLGKKAVPQYSFGLGKRQGKYSFGLGKKDRPYSFGLGKRYSYLSTDADDEVDADAEYNDIDDEKRSKYEGQKFSFGLGKREFDDFLETEDDNILDRQIRGPHAYNFGLGKRSLELPLKSIPSLAETKETRPENKTTP